MAAWSAIALRQSRTVLDQVKFYDVQIQAQMAQGMPAVAIDIALTALTLLGIPLPEAPTPTDLQTELSNTKALWAERAVADLIHLPLMTEREKVAAMILLSSIFAPSFIAKPEILPFIACQQIQLSIQFGNCAQSAFGYANYSAILNIASRAIATRQLTITIARLLGPKPTAMSKRQPWRMNWLPHFISRHTDDRSPLSICKQPMSTMSSGALRPKPPT